MAMLIPLLMPHIIEATANLGIGISNAIQGDSSSVSFRIGGKVFSTRDTFNFTGLPMEVRRKIVHMALSDSKGLFLDLPPLQLGEPLTPQRLRRITAQNPLNPESQNYMSTAGDAFAANGYPLSTWRWMTVSSEWSSFTREVLWRELELLGHLSYSRFLKLLDKGLQTSLIRSVTFGEGFEDPSDIYIIMAALKRLEKVSILPNYPATTNMFRMRAFALGLQLVPKVQELVLGLPLETSTNTTSRKALSNLPLKNLTVTFHSPSSELFEEIRALQPMVELDIRYIAAHGLVEFSAFFCDALQAYRAVRLHLHLPRPRLIDQHTEDPNSTTNLYLTRILSYIETASPEVQGRYSIYKVFNWDIPGAEMSLTRIWPVEAEVPTQIKESPKVWERQTDLKLFGGLIGLRLESKKT